MIAWKEIERKGKNVSLVSVPSQCRITPRKSGRRQVISIAYFPLTSFAFVVCCFRLPICISMYWIIFSALMDMIGTICRSCCFERRTQEFQFKKRKRKNFCRGFGLLTVGNWLTLTFVNAWDISGLLFRHSLYGAAKIFRENIGSRTSSNFKLTPKQKWILTHYSHADTVCGLAPNISWPSYPMQKFFESGNMYFGVTS